MNRVGKILVFVNLGLSLAFAAWALGLYTQRIDWASRTPEGGEKVIGRVEQLAKQVKDLYGMSEPAEARWKTNRAALETIEAQVPLRRAWYADQMNILLKGTDLKGAKASVLNLVIKDGLLVLEAPGRAPVTIGGQPVLDLDSYLNKFKEAQTSIKEVQADISTYDGDGQLIGGLVKNLEDLTAQSVNLRNQITGEEIALQKIKDETESLQPVLVNTRAEGELLVKRRISLRARYEELRAAGLGAED